jgi:hypothetical protein
MADEPVGHKGENSPEYVAWILFKEIATIEAPQLQAGRSYTRQYILQTYAECLITVQTPGIKWKGP